VHHIEDRPHFNHSDKNVMIYWQQDSLIVDNNQDFFIGNIDGGKQDENHSD